MSGLTKICIYCKQQYSTINRTRTAPTCPECKKEQKRKYAREYYHEVRKKVLKKRKANLKRYHTMKDAEGFKEKNRKAHRIYEHKKYFATKERVLQEIYEGKVELFPCTLCHKALKYEKLIHCSHKKLGRTFLCPKCFETEKNYGVNL